MFFSNDELHIILKQEFRNLQTFDFFQLLNKNMFNGTLKIGLEVKGFQITKFLRFKLISSSSFEKLIQGVKFCTEMCKMYQKIIPPQDRVKFTIAERWTNRTIGLCGIANQDQSDDFKIALDDVLPTNSRNAFIQSWQKEAIQARVSG